MECQAKELFISAILNQKPFIIRALSFLQSFFRTNFMQPNIKGNVLES